MTEEKHITSNKHLDFVAFLRNSMYVPEKEVGSVTVAVDNDAENEIDSELMRELTKKFDELFDPID